MSTVFDSHSMYSYKQPSLPICVGTGTVLLILNPDVLCQSEHCRRWLPGVL